MCLLFSSAWKILPNIFCRAGLALINFIMLFKNINALISTSIAKIILQGIEAWVGSWGFSGVEMHLSLPFWVWKFLLWVLLATPTKTLGGRGKKAQSQRADSGSQASGKSRLVYCWNWANMYTPLPASHWLSDSQTWCFVFLIGSLHRLIWCQWPLAMQADSRLAGRGSISGAWASIVAGPHG